MHTSIYHIADLMADALLDLAQDAHQVRPPQNRPPAPDAPCQHTPPHQRATALLYPFPLTKDDLR